MNRLALTVIIGFCLNQTLISPADAQVLPNEQRKQKLEQLLRRFPEADTNADGKLTPDEARVFRHARTQGQPAQTSRNQPRRIDPPESDAVRDLVYHEGAAADSRLNSLDVYSPKAGKDLPLLIFVHGGGWKKGDKAKAGGIAEFFNGLGYVVASVNYRLWPEVGYKEQATDVARAIRWLQKNASRFRASGNEFYLAGHSAGAHLVALVGADRRYLEAESFDLSLLRGVIAMDVHSYDIPKAVEQAKRDGHQFAVNGLEGIFGTDPVVQQDASPALHVAPGRYYPPFLLIYSRMMNYGQNKQRKETVHDLSKQQSEILAAVLRSAGAEARAVEAAGESHVDLVRGLGDPNDQPTREIMLFLKKGL